MDKKYANLRTCNLQYEGDSSFGLALWIIFRAQVCKAVRIKERPN